MSSAGSSTHRQCAGRQTNDRRPLARARWRSLLLAVSQGAQFTGLDADPSILGRARTKAAAAGCDITFDEGMSNTLPYGDDTFDVVLSTVFFHHLPDESKHETAAELRRALRPGGRLVVGDLGRPQDPLMRVAVRGTVRILDGVATTSLNVRGGLPDVLRGAGFDGVTVRDQFRTPTGRSEVITGRSRPS